MESCFFLDNMGFQFPPRHEEVLGGGEDRNIYPRILNHSIKRRKSLLLKGIESKFPFCSAQRLISLLIDLPWLQTE